jgi:glycosyltransferase involved in cell wall biosynthesis
MTAVIVIPVFDEAAAVGRVVAAARVHAPVLVVDDGSRDDSGAVAARAGAEVLRHGRRLGKAQALLTGIAAARRRGASVLVTLDGDGQHDPAAIPALLQAAGAARRSVIVGNRLDGPGAVPGPRRNAICVATFFANWASGLALRDTQSGFRVYPLTLFDEVRTRRGGFVFETEILLAAAERGWAVQEVAVAALARAQERSRFRPLRDGVAIGSFLAGRVVRRWAREARTLATELLSIFERERRIARHSAMLTAASPYADSPARWSAAIGAVAARRAALRLGSIWRAARARGTGAAAVATLATPLVLPLLLLQTLAGPRLPDVLTPFVEAVYGPAWPAEAEPEGESEATAEALAEQS